MIQSTDGNGLRSFSKGALCSEGESESGEKYQIHLKSRIVSNIISRSQLIKLS